MTLWIKRELSIQLENYYYFDINSLPALLSNAFDSPWKKQKREVDFLVSMVNSLQHVTVNGGDSHNLFSVKTITIELLHCVSSPTRWWRALCLHRDSSQQIESNTTEKKWRDCSDRDRRCSKFDANEISLLCSSLFFPHYIIIRICYVCVLCCLKSSSARAHRADEKKRSQYSTHIVVIRSLFSLLRCLHFHFIFCFFFVGGNMNISELGCFLYVNNMHECGRNMLFFGSFTLVAARNVRLSPSPPHTCFPRDEIQRLLSLRLLSSNQRSPFFVEDFDLKHSHQTQTIETTRGLQNNKRRIQMFHNYFIVRFSFSCALRCFCFNFTALMFEFEPPWYCTLSTLTDHVRFVVQLQASSEQERIERREFTFFLLSFQRVGPLFETGEISIHLPKPLMSLHKCTNYMLYTAANFVAGLPILIHWVRLVVRSPMSFATLRENFFGVWIVCVSISGEAKVLSRELCLFVQSSRCQLYSVRSYRFEQISDFFFSRAVCFMQILLPILCCLIIWIHFCVFCSPSSRLFLTQPLLTTPQLGMVFMLDSLINVLRLGYMTTEYREEQQQKI